MYSHAHTVSSIKSLISHIALCVCGDCSCQNKCAVNYISLDVLVADSINSSNTVKCTVSPYMYLCLVTLRQMSCHDIMPDFSPGNVNSLPLNMLDLIWLFLTSSISDLVSFSDKTDCFFTIFPEKSSKLLFCGMKNTKRQVLLTNVHYHTRGGKKMINFFRYFFIPLQHLLPCWFAFWLWMIMHGECVTEIMKSDSCRLAYDFNKSHEACGSAGWRRIAVKALGVWY